MIDPSWRLFCWIVGLPLLALGILLGLYAGIDEGAGMVKLGAYLAAFIGFLLCSIAFIYRK